MAISKQEATDEALSLTRQLDHVAIWMALHYAIDASKKPCLRLLIKAGQRKYETAVEVVAARVVLFPAPPFFSTSNKHIQWLFRPVVLREVDLVFLGRKDWKNLGQVDWHIVSFAGSILGAR